MSSPKIGQSSHQHHTQHLKPKGTQPASHASSDSGAAPLPSGAKADPAALRHVASQVKSNQVESSHPTSPADLRGLKSDLRRARTNAHLGGPATARTAQAEQNLTVTNNGRTTEQVVRRTREATFIRRVTQSALEGGPPVERLILDTGGGNDTVRVEANTGRNQNRFPLVVTVNGERHLISAANAARLSIRAGQGNDRVLVGKNVLVNVTIEAGAGNDRIRGGAGDDRIEGGGGSDVISGGGGRDYINGSRGADRIAGGAGNDVIYGGDGGDRLVGDAGNDYLEGSRGNDRLYGDNGRDVLSGGTGGDVLSGGAQRDVMYAGAGRDRLAGGTGVDSIYGEAGVDRVSGALNDKTYYVEIISTLGTAGVTVDPNSSSEFRERVEADLEMLRSSRVGQEMLRRLDAAALSTQGRNHVTIAELPDEENGFAIPDGNGGVFLNRNSDGTGSPNTGDAATIRYNTQFYDDELVTPITTLYHEMAHTYNFVTGTLEPGQYSNPDDIDDGVNNRERQAVGLPNTGLPFDNDNDPSTPPSSDNPAWLTENALRAELGLPHRNSYRRPLPVELPSPNQVEAPTPEPPPAPASLAARRRR